MRKKKGPGEECEMLEDDKVGVNEENAPKRLADKPIPVKESSGSEMPPPGSSGSRSRLQRTRTVGRNANKESGSECTSVHLSALSTDSEVNEVIGRREKQKRSMETVDGPLSKMKIINDRLTTTLVELFKVPGALVKETLSLAAEYALIISKLLS